MIRQCLIIFGCLAVGEFIVWLTGISIPSSIIGMLLLAILLNLQSQRTNGIQSEYISMYGNLCGIVNETIKKWLAFS